MILNTFTVCEKCKRELFDPVCGECVDPTCNPVFWNKLRKPLLCETQTEEIREEEEKPRGPLTLGEIRSFPGWRESAKESLRQWEKRKEDLIDEYRFDLFSSSDEFPDKEEREIVEYNLERNFREDLAEIEKHLSRLRRLLYPNAKPLKGNLTQADIERAKTVPCESLLPDRAMKKSGVNLSCLCPFHDDRSPSLAIHTGKNLWNCFACNKGGDSIKLFMWLEGIGFVEAVRTLAGMEAGA